MKTFHADQLVSVAIDGETLDGIVFEPQGLTKVVVLATDGTFHTLHPKYVNVREHDGPDDEHMREVIHRTRPHGSSGAPGTGGVGARSGFHAPSPHRPTGRGG